MELLKSSFFYLFILEILTFYTIILSAITLRCSGKSLYL